MQIDQINFSCFEGYGDLFFTTGLFNELNKKNKSPDFSLAARDYDGKVLGALLLSYSNQNKTHLKSYGGYSFGGIVTKERGKNLETLVIELSKHLKLQGVESVEITYPPPIYSKIPDVQKLFWLNVSNSVELKHEEAFTSLPIAVNAISRSKKKFVSLMDPNIFWNSKHDINESWELLYSNLMQRYSVEPFHSVEDFHSLVNAFPQNIKWNVYKIENQIVACQFYFIMDGVVHSQYVGSSPKGKSSHAIDKLTGNALAHFMGKAHFFDFGKSTESKGAVLNDSLFEYKMRWGGLGFSSSTIEYHL